MAREHFVEKARKDNPVAKKGESYYWWQFRFGPKHFSKTKPTRSQLTQSEFLSTLYSLEDGVGARFNGLTTQEDIESELENLKDEIQQLSDETQEKLDNMPEQLQYAPSGELLQERVDGLENWISELDGVDTDIDEWLKDEKEELEERIQEIINEITSIESGL